MPDPTPLRLLIVDEQPGTRQMCAAIAGRLGLECAQLESADAALAQMTEQAAELILADFTADGEPGLEWLADVKRRWPLTEVALMSSYRGRDGAVQAMRLGAYDFVVKPFRAEEFQLVLERMMEKARLVRENKLLRSRLRGRANLAVMSMPPCTDLEELERLTVERVFEQVGGDKEEARRLLGISRATLYRKIKRYGIGRAKRKPEQVASAAGRRKEISRN